MYNIAMQKYKICSFGCLNVESVFCFFKNNVDAVEVCRMDRIVTEEWIPAQGRDDWRT